MGAVVRAPCAARSLGGGDRSRTGDGGFAVVSLRPGKTIPAADLVSAATTAATWSWEPATY